MKKYLLSLSLLFSVQAKADFLFKIPVVKWGSVIQSSPASEVRAYCDRYNIPGTSRTYPANCSYVALRPDATYGQKVVIIVSKPMAEEFLKSKFNPYVGIPDPVSIVATDSSGVFDSSIATGLPEKYPPEGLPATDPDMGYKDLYCVGSVLACGGIGAFAFQSAGIKTMLTMLHFCGKVMTDQCGRALEAHKKEVAYYVALQEKMRERGHRPTPFEQWATDTIWNPWIKGAIDAGGGATPDGGGTPSSGATIPGGSGLGTCVNSTITMEGGPLGEYIEEQSVDCYGP